MPLQQSIVVFHYKMYLNIHLVSYKRYLIILYCHNRVSFRIGWQEVKRSTMPFSIRWCQQIHRYLFILFVPVSMY